MADAACLLGHAGGERAAAPGAFSSLSQEWPCLTGKEQTSPQLQTCPSETENHAVLFHFRELHQDNRSFQVSFRESSPKLSLIMRPESARQSSCTRNDERANCQE